MKIITGRWQVAADDAIGYEEAAALVQKAVRGIGNIELPAKGDTLLGRPLLFGAADIKRGPETRVKKEIKP